MLLVVTIHHIPCSNMPSAITSLLAITKVPSAWEASDSSAYEIKLIEEINPLHRVHDVLQLLRLVQLLKDGPVRLPVFGAGRSDIVHAGRHPDRR